MRICLIGVLFILSLTSPVRGQGYSYFGFGYHAGYSKMSGLNYFVKRYNETRTWLSEPMAEFHVPKGFTFTMGAAGPVMVDFTWTSQKMKSEASGIQPNGVKAGREVSWKHNLFRLGIGITPRRISWGVSFDMGNEKVYTRLSQNGSFDTEDPQEIQKEFIFGSTFFAQYPVVGNGRLGLLIRPYVCIPWRKADYIPVSYTINSSTWQNDNPEKLRVRQITFGVSAFVALVRS